MAQTSYLNLAEKNNAIDLDLQHHKPIMEVIECDIKTGEISTVLIYVFILTGFAEWHNF